MGVRCATSFLLLVACTRGNGDDAQDTVWTPPSETGITKDDTDVPPDDTAVPTGDTAPADTCPAAVRSVPVRLCFESDVALDADAYGTVTGTVEGTIAASGGFADDPDGVAVPGFAACVVDSDVTDMVRVRDADGAEWTFAWGVDGDAAADEVFAAGEAVTLDWIRADTGYGFTTAVVIHDGTGVRYVVDQDVTLDPATVGGLVVTTGERCSDHDDLWGAVDQYQLVFSGTALWPGESAAVAPGPDPALTVYVPEAFEYPDCADGCSFATWMAWR